MCNPRNYSDTPPTSKSTVEELHEPIPSLFRALTEGDTQLNWNIISFPVAEELSHHENLVSFLETVNQPHHQNVSVPSNNVHAPYSNDKGNCQQVTCSILPHFCFVSETFVKLTLQRNFLVLSLYSLKQILDFYNSNP